LEAGFGSIETILSVVSNLISFIRVGAFALNHVGLYLAFAAIASMFSSAIGSISMLVLGNIVIIALEGLIVFIQSMRLEYYELFSKYYTGEGTEYEPVSINQH
jgi:V/A-type H+-transporting ATPase subunit I